MSAAVQARSLEPRFEVEPCQSAVAIAEGVDVEQAVVGAQGIEEPRRLRPGRAPVQMLPGIH
ncbi:hypothetical protein ACNSTU_16140 [Aquisalimonas sp. APHAB1-3]|uniref:hypothetical protein n=1 Tax=Aquisalimonas sp. APHAB1-3 TaxID=3402080 RepID=UPI003AB08275